MQMLFGKFQTCSTNIFGNDMFKAFSSKRWLAPQSKPTLPTNPGSLLAGVELGREGGEEGKGRRFYVCSQLLCSLPRLVPLWLLVVPSRFLDVVRGSALALRSVTTSTRFIWRTAQHGSGTSGSRSICTLQVTCHSFSCQKQTAMFHFHPQSTLLPHLCQKWKGGIHISCSWVGKLIIVSFQDVGKYKMVLALGQISSILYCDSQFVSIVKKILWNKVSFLIFFLEPLLKVKA